MPLVDIVQDCVAKRRVYRTRLVAKPATLSLIWILRNPIATITSLSRSNQMRHGDRAWKGVRRPGSSISATAADILQLGAGPGVFCAERILVGGSRRVFFRDRGLLHFRRVRGVVARQARIGVFDHA